MAWHFGIGGSHLDASGAFGSTRPNVIASNVENVPNPLDHPLLALDD